MEDLQNIARLLGIEISQKELGQFDIYLKELSEWNERTNLTAIKERSEVITKHFIDSLTLLQAIPAESRSFADIGSGAGFPGLPLKIMRPDLEMTLIEATSKKVEFLSHMIETLGLAGIQAVHGRAEEFAQMQEYREQFDMAAARAVAELSVLAEFALPFVKVGGTFIAQKNNISSTNAEIAHAESAIRLLGGEISRIIPIHIPALSDRSLVIIRKIAPAPAKYPRRSGMPSKYPL
jgi:16S rRNA (guanine527-N7)-methyltransferase